MTKKEFYDQPIYSQKFLKYNLSIVSPQTGIIEVDSSKNIEINIKNLKSKRILYNFIGQRYAQKPEIKIENEISTLIIKNPQRNSMLYIFIENELALEFKILVD